MSRLPLAVALLALVVARPAPASAQNVRGEARVPFSVVEATIPQMREALAQGRVTSRELVLQYLARIGLHEKRLNAVMAVNPRVLQEADRLDRERAEGRIRGPLHGIPIAL